MRQRRKKKEEKKSKRKKRVNERIEVKGKTESKLRSTRNVEKERRE